MLLFSPLLRVLFFDKTPAATGSAYDKTCIFQLSGFWDTIKIQNLQNTLALFIGIPNPLKKRRYTPFEFESLQNDRRETVTSDT